MIKFSDRLNRHENAEIRIIPNLKQSGWKTRKIRIETTDNPVFRTMEEYLDPKNQKVIYKADNCGFPPNGSRWYDLELKSSFLERTQKFSIELGSIETARREGKIIIGEVFDGQTSKLYFIHPKDSFQLWKTICVPWVRWGQINKVKNERLIAEMYPDKQCFWDDRSRGGSGTPYVLIHVNAWDMTLDLTKV